jgi:hypothetical protein
MAGGGERAAAGCGAKAPSLDRSAPASLREHDGTRRMNAMRRLRLSKSQPVLTFCYTKGR